MVRLFALQDVVGGSFAAHHVLQRKKASHCERSPPPDAVFPAYNAPSESRGAAVLNVFLTVDTEYWPRVAVPDERAVRAAVRRDVLGLTGQGEFGVRHQMAVLNEHGLRGVFLVEALSACVTGIGTLRAVVDVIRDGGHEVQLHVHPEWLRRIRDDGIPSPPRRRVPSSLPPFRGPGMKDYSLAEQSAMISRSLANLAAAGVEGVRAFRAGGYGANLDTLEALADNAVAFDTSYNVPWLGVTCEMELPRRLHQATWLNGVVEVPVTHFADYPGHVRHAELCACSFGELCRALEQAWRRGWRSFVIVSHSFELVRRRASLERPPVPSRLVITRWRQLCEHLAAHRGRYRTAGFADLDADDVLLSSQPSTGLHGSLPDTAWRMAEQIVGRWL